MSTDTAHLPGGDSRAKYFLPGSRDHSVNSRSVGMPEIWNQPGVSWLWVLIHCTKAMPTLLGFLGPVTCRIQYTAGKTLSEKFSSKISLRLGSRPKLVPGSSKL